MKIRLGLAELSRHVVVHRTWVLGTTPADSRESGLFVEDSGSLIGMAGQSAVVRGQLAAFVDIGRGSRSHIDAGESVTMRFDGPELGVRVFALAMPQLGYFKIRRVIGSGSRGVVAHLVLLDHIESLGLEGVLLMHAGFDLVLVLNQKRCTLPTPGCLCSCGMR